ncbi:MAG: hypothetical protein ACTHNH_21125 [Mesorhizobium sp.]
MTVFTKRAVNVFAPTTAAGVARGADMGEAMQWGTEVERATDGAAAGRVDQSTWAGLATITGTRAGQPAIVYGPDAGSHTDPVVGGTVANVGEYYWSASPEGWRRAGNLQRTLVHALSAGAGTANAVQAISDVQFSTAAYEALITVNFTAANTGAMTLAINGETPRPLVTNTGEAIPSGYVKPKMSALVQIDSAGNYRLFSYGDATAVQASAEAAQAAAEAAQTAAEAVAAAIASAPQWAFASKAALALFNPAVAPDFVTFAGYASAGDGGSAIYRKVSSEPSHAGKVQDGNGQWYELAEINPKPEMFGAAGDGSTDDTTALADMLAYAPAGADIDLRRKSYKYTTLSVAKDVTLRNGSLLCAATTGVQITVNPAARLTARKVKFTGGGSETTADANQNHSLISQIGASRIAPGVGMDIEGCEFSGCGYILLLSKWCNGHRFVGNKFSDFAYAGFMVLSCNDGIAMHNRVEGQDAVGIGGDAYGISFTHWSLGYNDDPNAGTPLAVNPFCNNWQVLGNTIIAPKIWEGIDFHGGYNNVVAFNRVFGALSGILLGCGSGDAANYAGWNNIITCNLVQASNEDGTAIPGLVAVYGITVQGGSASQHDCVTVTNNIIRGYGGQVKSGGVAVPNNLVPALNINVYVQRLVCTGNTVAGWSGCAISISQGAGSAVLDSNMFSGMRDTQASSAVIRFQSDAPGRYSIDGCVLDDTGNAPAFGVVTSSTVKGRITYGSDFRRATTEVAGGFTSPGEVRSVQYA